MFTIQSLEKFEVASSAECSTPRPYLGFQRGASNINNLLKMDLERERGWFDLPGLRTASRPPPATKAGRWYFLAASVVASPPSIAGT